MHNSQEVASTIKSLLKAKNISAGKMLSDLGLNKNSLVTMQSSGYLPRVETLVKIADYLGCSVDYLLGRTNVPDEKSFADAASRLNAEQLKQLISYMEFLQSQHDAEAQKKTDS